MEESGERLFGCLKNNFYEINRLNLFLEIVYRILKVEKGSWLEKNDGLIRH